MGTTTLERFLHLSIRFPDRTMLEGHFASMENMHRVHSFVKENLRVPDMPFYLYTTPPRQILKIDSTPLRDLQFVPAVLIHFGCEGADLYPVCLSRVLSPLRVSVSFVAANN